MRNRPLWIILTAALLVRGVLLLGGWRRPQRFFTPDSHTYDELARSMIERAEFSRTGDARPEIFRTPGYPAFLAAVYALTAKSVQAALAVQVLLDVLLCFLVYRLGEQLCSRRVGLMAAAVQALSPAAVVASVRLLSGSLFALLLVAVVLLLMHYFRAGRLRTVLAGGALMGLACLTRPIGLPVVVIPAAVLLGKRRWRAAVAFVAVAAAVVVPWIVRNAVTAGYGQLSAVSDYNLFYCNAMAVLEADPSIELTDDQRELAALPKQAAGLWPDAVTLADPDFIRRCRREGLAILFAHPFLYAGVHARTTLNVFLPAATDVLEVAGATTGGKGTLAVLRREGLLAAVRHYFGGALWPLWLCGPMLLLTAGKFLAAGAGALRHVRWRMGPALWLICGVVLCFVAIPGPVAHARFRVPIAPLLSLAAGAGLSWLVETLPRKRPAPAG